MKRKISTWLIFVAVFSVASICQGVEVGGLKIPEQLELADKKGSLVLNGAGIRKKVFIKVYVGALYLPRKSGDLEEVLAMDGPKVVTMDILYSKIDKAKLVDGWNEGFKKNNTGEQLNALSDRLNKFNGYFVDVNKGEKIELRFIPGTGTQVWITGTLRGTITGKDFNDALLKVWLGEDPVNKKLKKAMLGSL